MCCVPPAWRTAVSYTHLIIGQGRIDEILSVKSTDRREMFEEAAGISRFRHRKEEAERKLERTDENLLRINDKIDELELQVEPLREQSERAKRFPVSYTHLTAEDHILHFAAPEGPGGLLPHDPADGVGNIGFSRPVGPDDGGDVLAEGQDLSLIHI